MGILSVNVKNCCANCGNQTQLDESQSSPSESVSADFGMLTSMLSGANRRDQAALCDCDCEKQKSNSQETDKTKEKSAKRTTKKSHQFECHKVRWVCNDCKNIYFKCMDPHQIRRIKNNLKIPAKMQSENDIITEELEYANTKSSKDKILTKKSSLDIESELRLSSEKSALLNDLKYEIQQQREKMIQMWLELVALLKNFDISPQQHAKIATNKTQEAAEGCHNSGEEDETMSRGVGDTSAKAEAVDQKRLTRLTAMWHGCLKLSLDINNDFFNPTEKVALSDPQMQGFLPSRIAQAMEPPYYHFPNAISNLYRQINSECNDVQTGQMRHSTYFPSAWSHLSEKYVAVLLENADAAPGVPAGLVVGPRQG